MSALFTIAGYEVRATDVWIVATAAASSVACGLLGCYLVLRRMSLLGDAISHAILPGLALAFIVTHSREPLPMLMGALVVGVATAVTSAGLSRWGKVPEDAAMGVVFTALFAVGVILITFHAHKVDLDPGCVLYGLLEMVPFDRVSVLGLELPRSFAFLSGLLCVLVLLIALFFKELKIVSFDPYLATTMGINAAVVHYALMTGVAATCVASFEAVGSILVVAMLVAPGATAHLLTDRLSRMLVISAVVATLSAVLGYVMSVVLNTSVAGSISTVALGLFVLAVVFAPRHGWLPRQWRRLALALRITQEDVLGLLYRWQEQQAAAANPHPPTVREVLEATHSGWLGRVSLFVLGRRGLVRSSAGALAPTQAGIEVARHVVRGHRLWETYLAKHLAVDPGRVHSPAHRAEHYLTPGIQASLDQDVGTGQDPHGKPIPPRD
ncbi:MAG TPA: metal ABC transporter permease [Phycisphaerales bacterium]|nr:metal ABC transporter permease [Phycisphaerales bacterium]